MVQPPKLDWSGWSDVKKPLDKDKPFHRFKCPTINGPQANGHGYDCGCRIPSDVPFDSLLEMTVSAIRDPRNVIRTTPSWVPVKINGKFITEQQEVEGVLIRSYQTWTDHPLLQFHRWYDWNFMVSPAPGFEYLMGEANKGEPIKDPDPAGFSQALIRNFTTAPVPGGNPNPIPSMECEFDCGLFGSRFGDKLSPKSFGFMFEWEKSDEDLAWPMVGQYFWGMGRWIYDCAHPTNDNRSGPNPGLTRSELHPCRALATARWEAFQFPENGKFHVPAIQFMFFATREGGYTDPEHKATFPEKKIEFILDLPEHTLHRGPFPIGHTPGVAHNTIVLPRLLKNVDFTSFEKAINKTAKTINQTFTPSKVEPIIEALRDENDPDGLPRQVKVTIPFGEGIGPTSADYYGMILSLGWSDPDLSQAQRVHKVKVTFDHVQALDSHDRFSLLSGVPILSILTFQLPGEFQLRYGVNGRWGQERKESVTADSPIPINNHKTVEFFLAEDDPIRIACHGEETDLVHDIYKEKTDQERELQMAPSEVLFFTKATDITAAHRAKSFVPGFDPGTADPDNPAAEERAVVVTEKGTMKYFKHCVGTVAGESADLVDARWVMSATESMLSSTLAVENDPLGRIDPHHRIRNTDLPNPITPLEVGGFKSGKLTGPMSHELAHSAELAEDPNQDDYHLFYTIETAPQELDT